MNEKITCALFGHRKMPPWVARELERTIDFLIGERGVRRFLVAGQGEFDRAAARSLARRMRENPSLDAAEVLAYLRNGLGTLPTVYPEGLERVPKGPCYPKRNEWMIRQADVVCVYSPRGRRCGEMRGACGLAWQGSDPNRRKRAGEFVKIILTIHAAMLDIRCGIEYTNKAVSMG